MDKEETTMESDKSLWYRFLSGDDDAYTTIYEMNIQSMYGYGMHYTSDCELLKDCIHDVFTSLFQNRRNLQPVKNIKIYLFVSLKNRLFNAYKQMRDYVTLENDELNFSVELSAEEILLKNEEYHLIREKVNQMLNSLTSKQKEVIYYRFKENLSYDEISELMNMNPQSVQNLLQRTLKKLRSTFPPSLFLYVLLLCLLK